MKDRVRKNISIKEDDYSMIKDYATKKGQTFSQFLCDSALRYIQSEEEADLLNYLNMNCSFVNEEEEKYIKDKNIDFSNTEGKEITLDELLQD